MIPDRTVIVGGGIGGMALAAALQRLGLPFVVLERADALGEVGSGLGVLPGAVRALEVLGVSPALFGTGARFEQFYVSSDAGDDLVGVRFDRIFERAGRAGYVMHRAALHAALVACAKPEAVRTGAPVEAVETGPAGVRVFVRGDAAPVYGDLLVGADGLYSVVRQHVLGDGPPRYAGETIFRGIARERLDEPRVSRELFGSGRRTAYYAMGRMGAAGEEHVYWWATSPLAEGTRIPPGQRRAHLLEAFGGWGRGVPERIERTSEADVLQNDIYDRKPARRWHRGRAVLLGDAAHPTTPNLGQGACMAIEDAVVLARCIALAPDPERAFRRFHRLRAARTARTVRLSRLWGRVGLWRHPVLVALRNGALRHGPEGWMERRGLDQYCYDPGGLPVPAGTEATAPR